MDILDFLQSQKIELGELDSESLKKDFYKNFKTVEEVNAKVEKLEATNKQVEELTSQLNQKGEELETLNKKLEDAERVNSSKISSLEGELKNYQLSNKIMDKGVKREHSDFVLYQLSKMEQDKDFDEDKGIEGIVKANPFLTEATTSKSTMPKGDSPKAGSSFNDIIRREFQGS